MRQPEDDPRIKMLLLQAEAASGPDYPNHKKGIIWGICTAAFGIVFGFLLGIGIAAMIKRAPAPWVVAAITAVLTGAFGYLIGAFRPADS